VNLPQVATSEASEPCPALAVEIGSSNLNIENIPSIRTPLAVSKNLFRSARRIQCPIDPLYPWRAPPGSSTSSSVRLTSEWQSLLERPESSAHQALPTRPYRDLQGRPSLNILLCTGESAQKWDLSGWVRLLVLKQLDNYNSQLSSQNLPAERKVYMRAVYLDRPSFPCGLRCMHFFRTAEILASLAWVGRCGTNKIVTNAHSCWG